MPKPKCPNCPNSDGYVSVSVPCPCCKGDKSGFLPPSAAYEMLPAILDFVRMVELGNTEYADLQVLAKKLLRKARVV